MNVNIANSIFTLSTIGADVVNRNWSMPEITVCVIGILIVVLVVTTIVIPALYKSIFKRKRRMKNERIKTSL